MASADKTFSEFVTRNAGKLNEVREILTQDEVIDVESRDIDRKPYSTFPPSTSCAVTLVSEIQVADYGPVITEDTALCFAVSQTLTSNSSGSGSGPKVHLNLKTSTLISRRACWRIFFCVSSRDVEASIAC